MRYRTVRPLIFVVGGGPATIECPVGTEFEALPEGALSWRDAADFVRMVRIEALRNPSARLIAVRWEGQVRALTIGEHLEPVRAQSAALATPEARAEPVTTVAIPLRRKPK